jgi:electron transfer flavoprotein alpha subunit
MNVAYELLGEGKKLAGRIGTDLWRGLLLGNKVEHLAAELFAYGADKEYLAEHPLLKDYTTDGYGDGIKLHDQRIKPEIVLYGATHIGRDLGAGLRRASIPGLPPTVRNWISIPRTRSFYRRARRSGETSWRTIICPNNRPQMAYGASGVMEKLKKETPQAVNHTRKRRLEARTNQNARNKNRKIR